MRARVLLATTVLGTALVASAGASVGTQQWSGLHLKVATQAPGATHAPGPVMETPSTLVGRPDDALRARPDPGAFSSFGAPPLETAGLKGPRPGAPVPEPGTISLLAMGLIGAGLGMRRRKSQ